MGVTWVQGNPAAFDLLPAEWLKSVELDVAAVMLEIVNEAADRMMTLIESTGALPNSANPPGRIDSGAMRDAVSARMTVNGREIVGEFGWINDQELYFLSQEYGATLWNGGHIEGAGYLIESGDIAMVELVAAVRAKLGA